MNNIMCGGGEGSYEYVDVIWMSVHDLFWYRRCELDEMTEKVHEQAEEARNKLAQQQNSVSFDIPYIVIWVFRFNCVLYISYLMFHFIL